MTSTITNQNNPYIIGRPIYEAEYFFGREDLFSFIQDNLNQKAKVILLHGQRRIGKSSVLAHIPNFVKLHNFVFVNLSLEGKSQKSLNDVLYELSVDILEYLEDEYQVSVKQIKIPEKQDFQKRQEVFFEDFLPQVYKLINDKNLVLLLDEFDVLSESSQDAAAEHFFPYLQSIINTQDNLYIIPVIGRQLDDLPNLLKVFHQAPNKKIGLLQKENAIKLIANPAKNILTYEDDAIDKILELSAGHPYFTQVICFALFSQAREEDKVIITVTDVENVIENAIEIGEAGLIWFRDGLSLTERVFISAVAEIQKQRSQLNTRDPLKLLKEKNVLITKSLENAGKKLIDGEFLNTSKNYPYYITIELVRLWLTKHNRLSRAIEELAKSRENIRHKNIIPSRFLTKIQEAKKEYSAKKEHFEELDLNNHWNTNEKDRLTKIPKEVFELKNLKILKLNHNIISKLSEFLGVLSNLTELHLEGNQLSSLPESFGNLTNLTKLNLGDNQLSSLPESFGNLTNLTELHLENNQLSKLPEFLGDLTNLTELHLEGNQLSSLPESFGNLTNLTKLNLGDNQLSNLPEFLGYLTNLTELNLELNQLSSLPESLGNLTNLVSLKLRYNQLSSLPKSLGNLTNLKLLHLSDNKLVTIPESLGNLTHLTTLYISGNTLVTVPESLGNLTNLTNPTSIHFIDNVKINPLNPRTLESRNSLVDIKPPQYKIIKIFLVSSSELESDRQEFVIFINRKNKEYIKKNIFLELILWEDFIDAMSATRLQDEYNKAVKDCDIFVSLFYTKVGKYTEEEFLKALETFKTNGKPLIYTYFKQAKVEITPQIVSLIYFQQKLSDLGHFYTKYDNINDLKFKFSEQLIKVLPKLTSISSNNVEQFSENKNQNFSKIEQNFYGNVVSATGNVEGDQTVKTTNNKDEKINQSRSINISGNAKVDVSGAGAFNLGDISGTVTNTINQLPNFDNKPDKQKLKELLSQLQNAILEAELDDEEKEETLEQIKVIASSLTNSQDGTVKKTAKTAMKVLRGTAAALPPSAAMVTICNQLPDLISKIF